MSSQTVTRFDLARFRQAVEQRDSHTQIAMYAPDATVTIADRITPPGSPRVIRGSEAIRQWIEDVCGREMSHQVRHGVADEHGAAFTEDCRYPDGTNVKCATVLSVSDGLITDQQVLQAWDEPDDQADAPAPAGDIRQETEHRSFGEPDETREFPHGQAEILSIGGAEVGRMTFQPGWRWSSDVQPIAGTESCQAPHFQYHVSGELAIRMDDGTEMIARPGDITSLPSGHDAWVVGEDPVVVVDWYGASNYAKRS